MDLRFGHKGHGAQARYCAKCGGLVVQADRDTWAHVVQNDYTNHYPEPVSRKELSARRRTAVRDAGPMDRVR